MNPFFGSKQVIRAVPWALLILSAFSPARGQSSLIHAGRLIDVAAGKMVDGRVVREDH